MKFLYTATTKDGKKSRGEIEATNRPAAVKRLKEKKLTVTSLAEVERVHELYFGVVSPLQKVVLTKHLGIMLRAGIPLDEALQVLESQSKGKLHQVLSKVRGDVESGMRLGDALAEYPRIFNGYYVNMIRAGEESGSLVENLEQLSLRYGKDYELKQKAQSALLYPALVLALTGGLGAIISLFVLPRLTGLFRAFEFELPWYTRALIAVSNFMADYGLIATIGGVIAVVALVWLARQPVVSPLTHTLYLHLPVVKKISRPLNLARFAMVLASLLKSGIPITVAVGITANVLGNMRYRQVLLEAVSRVETGEPLSSVLAESALFPAFATRMIMIGEQTGKLEDVLAYLAEFYETELDITLKNLSTIIEPVLLISIGIIVASVALSILTPIYNFIGSIE
jgi:type IV pilus assembly protein PilC